MWRIGMLHNGHVVFWEGEAASPEEAEAKALEQYPGAQIKSGTEL